MVTELSDEVFRIFRRLDMDAVEVQTSLQCAPLLTGIKMSNLLHVPTEQVGEVLHLFEHSPISCHILYDWNHRVSMLLYRKETLRRYMEQKRVKEAMELFGYHEMQLEDVLRKVSERNQAYVEGVEPYPHEIGLLLGYPPEDVLGFIEHKGRNYVLSGYWKVYGDPVRAQRIFRAYDRARDAVIRLIGNGHGVTDIMTFYNVIKRKQLLTQI